MTADPHVPDPNLFSSFSSHDFLYRVRRDTFLYSLVAQAAILGIIAYFTSCVIRNTPEILKGPISNLGQLPLIFSGHNGGGGGQHDPVPASRGNLPRASLFQIVLPDVIVPNEMHKLPVEETVVIAPELKYPQGGQIGDPSSVFSKILSNGPGGPGGIGKGCCDGVGDSVGPGAGNGPPGIFPAGKLGVTVPEMIYNPEPSFSDEARKSKTQGVVLLLLVVGKDGRPYNIHVGQSLGMGLDEKAMEAVNRWRFRPATLNGQPVATRIAVQVEFHLY